MEWALVHTAEENFFLIFYSVIVMVVVIVNDVVGLGVVDVFFILVILGLYKIVIIVAPRNACFRFIFDSLSLFFNRNTQLRVHHKCGCVSVCVFMCDQVYILGVCARHLIELTPWMLVAEINSASFLRIHCFFQYVLCVNCMRMFKRECSELVQAIWIQQ